MDSPIKPEWTYWIEPGRILGGCYPGDPDPELHPGRAQELVRCGIRSFINLMEEFETDHNGRPFLDYREPALAAARGVELRFIRLPVPDNGIPAPGRMAEILDALEASLSWGAVYIHCWGGIGRTGTAAGCRLIETGAAPPDQVLELLARLRRGDVRNGARPAPHTEAQRNFVRAWRPSSRSVAASAPR